jgi:hypothetical protein
MDLSSEPEELFLLEVKNRNRIRYKYSLNKKTYQEIIGFVKEWVTVL